MNTATHTHHYVPTREKGGLVLKCQCGQTPPPPGPVRGQMTTSDITRVNALDFGDREYWLASNQPPKGSVVLAYGATGTAYQRHYRDGLWHGTNGKRVPWSALVDSTDGNILILTWTV